MSILNVQLGFSKKLDDIELMLKAFSKRESFNNIYMREINLICPCICAFTSVQ